MATRWTARVVVGTLMLLAGMGATTPARSVDMPVVPVIIASIASVQASATDKDSVLDFLKHYESTLASGRVEEIVALYANFDTRRRSDVDEYFHKVISGLEVRLEQIRIDVDRDRALVAFDRTDHFTDRESGLPVNKTISLARHLERQGNSWKMMLDGR